MCLKKPWKLQIHFSNAKEFQVRSWLYISTLMWLWFCLYFTLRSTNDGQWGNRVPSFFSLGATCSEGTSLPTQGRDAAAPHESGVIASAGCLQSAWSLCSWRAGLWWDEQSVQKIMSSANIPWVPSRVARLAPSFVELPRCAFPPLPLHLTHLTHLTHLVVGFGAQTDGWLRRQIKITMHTMHLVKETTTLKKLKKLESRRRRTKGSVVGEEWCQNAAPLRWYTKNVFAQSKMILSRAWLHDTVSCAAWNDARKGVYLKPLFQTPCSNCYWGWSIPIMLDYRDISLMESVPVMWGPVTASPVGIEPMTIFGGGGAPPPL